jgi:hypothetical protein
MVGTIDELTGDHPVVRVERYDGLGAMGRLGHEHEIDAGDDRVLAASGPEGVRTTLA